MPMLMPGSNARLVSPGSCIRYSQVHHVTLIIRQSKRAKAAVFPLRSDTKIKGLQLQPDGSGLSPLI